MENDVVLAHACGQCGGQFTSEAEYLVHLCPETGVDPTHPASMGLEYQAIQNAALARGSASQEAQPEPVAPEHKPLDIVQVNAQPEEVAPADTTSEVETPEENATEVKEEVNEPAQNVDIPSQDVNETPSANYWGETDSALTETTEVPPLPEDLIIE